MDKQKLKEITDWLIDNVIQNTDIMFDDVIRGELSPTGDNNIDLVEVIVYLHNRLSECIEGEPYDYMFHWANKIGADVRDVTALQETVIK